jgi:hypothetical protein
VTLIGKEFNVLRNKIVLKDNLFGIFNEEIEHEIIDIQKTPTEYIRSNQVGSKKGNIFYANFILTEKNHGY